MYDGYLVEPICCWKYSLDSCINMDAGICDIMGESSLSIQGSQVSCILLHETRAIKGSLIGDLL